MRWVARGSSLSGFTGRSLVRRDEQAPLPGGNRRGKQRHARTGRTPPREKVRQELALVVVVGVNFVEHDNAPARTWSHVAATTGATSLLMEVANQSSP